MKKIITALIFVFTICLLFTGCEKEKKEEEKNQVTGGWQIVLSEKQVGLDDNTLEIFDKAAKNRPEDELEPVALLGEQIVAGRNYMYLVKARGIETEAEPSYMIAIVYKDLQNKASITKLTNFNITEYAGVDIPRKTDAVLDGSWEVSAPGKLNMLEDENVQTAFDKATADIKDVSYNPIAVVGKQIVAGTNYAVISYARDTKDYICVLTIYNDLQGNAKVIYSAYVDLADFNK